MRLFHEQLLAHLHGVLRALSEVPLDSRMIVNLIVVATFESFIPKEVNFVIFSLSNEVQAVGLDGWMDGKDGVM